MIGLKRGAVRLCEHEKEWETEAQNTILRLKRLLGSTIVDIQHVGSTAVPAIKAKPIIDIALAVENFDDLSAFEGELEKNGFYNRVTARASSGNQRLLACGSFYDGSGDLQTHFIHVVHAESPEWNSYISFRDYLNSHPSAAREYENLKESLAGQAAGDRERYTSGKQEFITYTLRKALVSSFLGKTVDIKIDRPLGSAHPRYPDMIYPINYGYIPNVFGGDGEELDVYLLGVTEPVKEYRAKVIGIVHRENDNEDKLIAAPENRAFYREEMAEAVFFQEQYFETHLETVAGK